METSQSPLILVLIFMLIHVLMLTVGVCMYTSMIMIIQIQCLQELSSIEY